MKNCKVVNYFKKKLSDKGQKLLMQIFKFIIVGGIATIIDWIIYYLLYNYLGFDPLVANILSYLLATIYNYFGSVRYVFKVNDKSIKKTFTIFLILSLVGLLLSELLIYLMINILLMNKMLSKIISTLLVMIFSFITRKYFLEK